MSTFSHPVELAGRREAALCRCDANLVAYVRYAVATAPGGEVGGDDRLVLFAGAHANPTPHVNGVIRMDPTVSADEALERARDFFGPKRRGFVVWSREHADPDIDEMAARQGLTARNPVEGIPGIYADIRMPELEADGAELRWVADEQTARDYLRLVGDGWEMEGAPDELVWKQFLFPQALLDPAVRAVVAYVDGRPASCCMAYVAAGVAGLYWAATARWATGKGLGRVCFCAVHNAGFDAGAHSAIGQSSAMGTPLWVKLGFEVVTHYRRYFVAPPQAAGGLSR